MKSILLESIEYLKKINPWKVNITEEINTIYEYLKKEINLIIAGIAADNASYIYNRKIDTIESIYRRKDYRARQYLDEVLVPKIKIRYNPGRSLIDISDIIDELYEIIEKKIKSYKEERETLTIDFEPYLNIEEEIRKLESTILEEINSMTYPILLSDLISRLHDRYSPLWIFYAILFLYMDEKIDFDTLENEEGLTIDLIIQPIE